MIRFILFTKNQPRPAYSRHTNTSEQGINVKKNSLIIILFLLILPVFGISQEASLGAGYKLLEKLKLGGEGGWDYLTYDTAAHRLYISRSTHVQVVDADKKEVVGDIPNTTGVHGIALVPALNRGFTSNGRDSSVTVFDLTTLKTIKTIKIDARNPDAIMYDPVSGRVFTFNGGSHNATAIDAQSDSVVGTIPLGDKPEFAVSDGKGMVYVNLEDSSMIVAIDARTLKVANRWSIAPGEHPSGLAIDREHRRLFSGCDNKMMVVFDPDNGKVVTTVPIGEGVDATAFDPATGLAFSSNGEGTLTVVHEDAPDKFTVIENDSTQRGARTMALDPASHRVYLSTAEFGPPPAPTADRPHPRPSVVPGSFTIVIMGRK